MLFACPGEFTTSIPLLVMVKVWGELETFAIRSESPVWTTTARGVKKKSCCVTSPWPGGGGGGGVVVVGVGVGVGLWVGDGEGLGEGEGDGLGEGGGGGLGEGLGEGELFTTSVPSMPRVTWKLQMKAYVPGERPIVMLL